MEMPELNDDVPEAGEVPEEPAEEPMAEQGEILEGSDEIEPDLEEGEAKTEPLVPSEILHGEGEDGEETNEAPEIKKPRLDEDEPAGEGDEPSTVTEGSPSAQHDDDEKADTDMLSTLASAALTQDEKPPVVEAQSPTSEKEKKRTEQWHTVNTFDATQATITDYLSKVENSDTIDLAHITMNGSRIQLEPGTAYRVRVCAVNACGAGPWSEVAAFKTTLPGFPGAPSAIKISKTADGANLTWEPPGGNSGEILEYAVYLAVRSQTPQPVAANPQLTFVRVYCGPTNKCVVGQNSLGVAHIDTSTKPAIIFRIAARNEKGYGPATQVRWLQEFVTPGAGAPKRRQ